MIRFDYIYAIILFSFATSLLTAQQLHRCHWHEIAREFAERSEDQKTASFIPTTAGAMPSQGVITIPVIFHIIHDGKSLGQGENVSTALLLSQIDQLNDDFRRQNSDKHLTPSFFLPDAADVEIEFCLATQDPDGFPTSGIQRYNFGVPDYSPSELKHVVQSKTTWDRDQYLNIWVADIRGYLGYAYLPGGESIGDGLVVDFITVGSLSNPNPYNSPFKYGRTATHEIGHWLGLYHHWANPNDCFSDDGIGDTPKQYSFYSGSPVHPQTSCGSTDMFMNFLDYVDDDAMNLFSKGQKNVMHNSINGLRSGLLSSTGCQAVEPVIMFERSALASLEGTESCQSPNQKYVEITMKIAKGPSRSATVTLQNSGNAVEGRDFTFSPKTISFPAGSSTPKTFKVMIHEDAYVENVKDIVISYQLLTGGGNARKGKKRQECTLTLIDDDFAAQPFDLMQKTVGQDMGSIATASPFQGSKSDGRMQAIYTANELSQSGLKAGWIESISYFITQKRSTQNFQDFSLRMTLTSLDKFPEYPYFANGFKQVYSQDIFTVAGTMKLNLDQPFYWDGYSNLMIESCFDNSSSSSDDVVKYENTGSQNETVISEFGQGGQGCNYNFMPSRHSLRPLIQLSLSHGSDVAIDENSGSGYVECELGPFEKIFVYDSDNNNVMMSVENLGGHDYGCTKIMIDREGIGTSRLWGSTYEATPKSFKIEPEFNLSSGSTKVELYYSAQEIDSWEQNNLKGDDKSQLRFIKCRGSIASSAPSECRAITATYSNYGNDYKFEATTHDGFSGFALSNWNGGGFLAITDIILEGNVNNDIIELKVEFRGEIENEDLEWLKKGESDNEWTPFYASPLNDHQLYIDENPSPGLTCYQVKTSSGIKSNVATVEYESTWKLIQTSEGSKIMNDQAEGTFIIYTLEGKELSRVWLDSYGQKILLQDAFAKQLVLIRKMGDQSTGLRKAIL